MAKGDDDDDVDQSKPSQMSAVGGTWVGWWVGSPVV